MADLLTIRATVSVFEVTTVGFQLFVDYLPEIRVHYDKIVTNKFLSITTSLPVL